jgi:uncharacterized DUF497 family protein
MQYKFKWDNDKNEILKKTRNISFEEIINAINTGKLVYIDKNSSKNHSNQEVYILGINNYIYVVPFVRKAPNSNEVFLKTIYKSRKYKKQYLGVKK